MQYDHGHVHECPHQQFHFEGINSIYDFADTPYFKLTHFCTTLILKDLNNINFIFKSYVKFFQYYLVLKSLEFDMVLIAVSLHVI